MVAHINPQEAAMLKAMGGSGTINPTTGLPEYWGGFLNPVRYIAPPVQQAIKAVQNLPGISVLSNAATQAVKPIDQALVGLDKTVGKAIPGGWGTVAAVAGSMAGVPPVWMAGLGALNGSGVMHKGGKFNLKGAMMGGAMAYGMAELGEYARGANLGTEATAPVVEGATEGATAGVTDGITSLYNATEGFGQQAASTIPQSAIDSANLVNPAFLQSGDTAALNALSAPMEAGAGAGLQVAPPPSIGSQIMSGNFGDALSQAGTNISEGAANALAKTQEGIANLGTNASNAWDAATTPSTYTDALSKGLENTQKTAGGIYDLITDPKAAIAQADKLVASGDIMLSPGKAAAVTAFGGMGLADLQAQQDYLNQQQASGAISNQEYATQMAAIDAARAKAIEAMQANPYMFGNSTMPTTSKGTTAAEAIKANPYMFAMGGNVQMNPPDDQTGMMNQTPMTNFDQSGVASMIGRTVPQQTFVAGGMPRFLSGGGDGLSDDIPAIIGDKQPAKLADGEFVVSSDVVSGLGGGSSKAGAKKLYEMMDRVRKQAHGTKKQIRPVNTKALPA